VSLYDTLTERMKAAMKARDEQALSTIRMVRARISNKQNEPDFSGELDDDLVQGEIAAYVKQVRKALPEYEKAGQAGAEMAEKLRFEIEYLSEFLPSMLDEAATKTLVTDAITSMNVTDPKRAGQVMGTIMKSHKGQVDPALVRRIVEQVLNAAG
jgi:uncharacterized protein YqeY